MANENYILLEKSLAIHYLNECSGSFCFHLSCNGGICLILGERQHAETVENLHKIFVDKISQKKYNEIGLYEICKKTGYIWIIIVILYILFARSR